MSDYVKQLEATNVYLENKVQKLALICEKIGEITPKWFTYEGMNGTYYNLGYNTGAILANLVHYNINTYKALIYRLHKKNIEYIFPESTSLEDAEKAVEDYIFHNKKPDGFYD